MTHYKSMTRIVALILVAFTLIGLLPVVTNAATIADGSTTCDVVPINQRQFLLTTTAGKRLGAFAYRYTTNDGLSGSAYCIDHVLNMTQHTLDIRGEYNASPATAGAFANGYPQHSLETFLGRFPGETMLNGLTEQEYMYATQIAVWATLGQLGIEGSKFTAGSEFVAQPTGDTQQMRVFRAVQLILDSADEWDRIYHTGMYIRLEENELGGNISIPADMTLEFAADQEQYGIKREVIGGTAYYTREYIFASATSTYYDSYCIEAWVDGAPSGTIFVDENNQELRRGEFRDTPTWIVPTEQHQTTLNDNGFEYSGKAKLCIPVDTAPNSGEITVNCGSYVMQYQIYLAYNYVATEQSYIIADPSKGTLTADAVIKWGGAQTETGELQVTKVGGGGQPLSGAKFTLSGSDGSSRSGTTDAGGMIEWTGLLPNVNYTLTETEAPAGYAIVDPVNVTIQAARTNYVTVKDSTQKVLIVRKVDAQNGYSLQGATIAFRQIDGSFYTTGVTDHAGVIQFDADALPLGSYEVFELTAPEGYELDPEKQTVDWNGRNDVTLTFRNVRKPKLVLYKCDEGNLRCLPGATFEIFRDGQLVTTVTTNDNGVATVPDVTEGYYTVIETVAPAGYVLDSTEHGIYVNPYDPATSADPQITVTNSATPHLMIRKLDAETQQPLSDTTFEVYRDSALIGSYTTDYNGEVLLSDLTPGTYVVKEIAVKDGYVLDPTPQQIEVKAGKEDYTVNYILTNVTYTGDQVWHKTYKTDVMPYRKERNRGQKPKYFAEGCCPAIINKEDFEMAQQLVAQKREAYPKGSSVESVFSKRVFCGECGAPCRRKNVGAQFYWTCWRHDHGKEACPTRERPEKTIQEAVCRFHQKIRNGRDLILRPVLTQLKELQERGVRADQRLGEIDAEIAKLTDQNLVLTRLKSKGYMDSDLYLSQMDELNARARELRRLRRGILEKTGEDEQIRRTEEMLDHLENSDGWTEELDPLIFSVLIDRLYLTADGSIRIRLQNGLEVEETLTTEVR